MEHSKVPLAHLGLSYQPAPVDIILLAFKTTQRNQQDSRSMILCSLSQAYITPALSPWPQSPSFLEDCQRVQVLIHTDDLLVLETSAHQL